MKDEIVLERISSLKGRLGYEEKKARKLGFGSIYEYMEDKINNENMSLDAEDEVPNKTVKPTKINNKSKVNTCGCC
jgi:hypothetical protein